MSTPLVSFAGLLSDAGLQMESAGFTTTMWTPDFEEQEDIIYPAQMLAAMMCFVYYFTGLAKRSWVHLAAEMQAGKTGVMTALIRLILANASRIGILPNNIFIITGMGDNAWRKQTCKRLPSILRRNVYHNGGLKHVQVAVGRLANRPGGLRNLLIINDESHIASAINNRPNTMIYSTIQRLCPVEEWSDRNIRFLTISATDPAKVLAMKGETVIPCSLVRLHTTDEYQSVEKLKNAGRIRYIEDIGTATMNYLRELIEKYDVPLYHIIRPSPRKHSETISHLRVAFPTANVIPWDSDTKKRTGSGDDDSSVSTMQDINELLETPPVQHTFIVLKNMFYAAKTMVDTHVGVMYDRAGNKDDTNLQSLLGRACGYGKSTRTIVITSKQTVTNYLNCWRDLCSDRNFEPNLQDTKMDKKMPFVRATGGTDGITMTQAPRHATPISSGGEIETNGGTRIGRATANEDDFESVWQEFGTFAEAKAYSSRIHAKKSDDAGFYLSSTTGETKRVTYNEVMGLKNGKKTANLPWGKLAVGKNRDRMYVAYKDTTDPSTAVFVVRRLTRIR